MSRRVAIIGSGISGLSAAHHLSGRADITLFEAADYFGGHTHTVDVTLPTAQGVQTHGVDTGFLVFNERTYPGLIALFEELQVETAKSDMSFSVQAPQAPGQRPLEWNGASLNTVFAQRRNIFNPRFIGMLREVLRFNTLVTQLAERNHDEELAQPLCEFLLDNRFGAAFCDNYLLPMLGCIWSCPTDQMLMFPLATMVRFCHNHGLVQVNNRPQWHTVRGGARHYVEKIIARIQDKRLNTPVRRIEREAHGVSVHTASGSERFDAVVLATHADQSLAMLAAPSVDEERILGAVRYHPNLAVLHTDASVMPKKKLAWAAWNYQRAAQPNTERAQVCLHYWLNQLQPLPFTHNVFVSLNPIEEIDPTQVMGRFEYAHPVFDLAAIRAQAQVSALQGQQNTWYAGAWMGYGFHEDGFKAGRDAALGVLAQ
jgi:predicted NAD/FAD-binding protein